MAEGEGGGIFSGRWHHTAIIAALVVLLFELVRKTDAKNTGKICLPVLGALPTVLTFNDQGVLSSFSKAA